MKAFLASVAATIVLGSVLILVGTGATWTSSSNVYVSQSIVTTTNNALAFDVAERPVAGETKRNRVLHNVGTVPVLYHLGTTCSATNYTDVLAAGQLTRDGLGSVVDLGFWHGQISIAVESGTGVVATLEVAQ